MNNNNNNMILVSDLINYTKSKKINWLKLWEYDSIIKYISSYNINNSKKTIELDLFVNNTTKFYYLTYYYKNKQILTIDSVLLKLLFNQVKKNI